MTVRKEAYHQWPWRRDKIIPRSLTALMETTTKNHSGYMAYRFLLINNLHKIFLNPPKSIYSRYVAIRRISERGGGGGGGGGGYAVQYVRWPCVWMYSIISRHLIHACFLLCYSHDRLFDMDNGVCKAALTNILVPLITIMFVLLHIKLYANT